MFIGFWLPEGITRALAQDSDELACLDGVAVARQPHVTMAFLGDVPDPAVPVLVDLLARVAASARPMRLRVVGRGAFPNRHQPRVLWYGVAGEVRRLASAVGEIRRETLALAPGQDTKPFQPHVTAARIRTGEIDPRIVRWLGHEQERHAWRLEAFSLIRTVPGRPYETIRTFPLRG